jgi:DNA (cytosine-5)-methyltransferase 1
VSGPRVVDLFAGAGGLTLGAEWAGCTSDIAIEIDAWACETLALNNPGVRVHQGDLREVSDDWVRREVSAHPDLVVGGPPCQGFSRAGPSQKDPKDPRNSLFREFVRIVRLVEPKLVLMENVPGILRARTATGAPVAEIIRAELESLGYQVRPVMLHAEEFGVPQIRRRVFFLASLEGLPERPLPTHRAGDAELFDEGRPVLTVRDAIGDLPTVDVGFKGPTAAYDREPFNDYQALMRAGAGREVGNHVPMRHSPRMVARFAEIAPGQGQSSVTDEHAPRRRVRAEDQGPGTYDQNNRRMHWDRPCHTLAASFYANFLHPELHRNFTPREGARLQSFPDRYVFCGKPTVVSQKLLAREGRHAERHLCQYNQIGNAVPPLLAKAAIETLLGVAAGDSAVDTDLAAAA